MEMQALLIGNLSGDTGNEISEMGGVPIASDTTRPFMFTISFDPYHSVTGYLYLFKDKN